MNGAQSWVSDLGSILLAFLALYGVWCALKSLSASRSGEEGPETAARVAGSRRGPGSLTPFERALFGARARWDDQTESYIKRSR